MFSGPFREWFLLLIPLPFWLPFWLSFFKRFFHIDCSIYFVSENPLPGGCLRHMAGTLWERAETASGHDFERPLL